MISQDVIRRQMLDGDDNKTIEVISNLLNFASKNYDIVNENDVVNVVFIV